MVLEPAIFVQAFALVAVTSLLATNVFERRAGEWLMTHHHASHTLPSPPAGGA